ncbi:hypothetical protein PSF97_04970 [Proteus mirabilis]|uniref:hypothetical protein n=1 Tax=Proteus mirabilis TaxID=584 RepID=UPI002362331F|nr:hypothetical protein [Proteus mirabilis]MDC9783947.1 hypothetical protein [Proteus mirabilis]
MRIECYSWSDVTEQILEQAIALQNSAFEDMKGNFYQVDIPYKLVLAIDDNQVIGHVAVYLRDVYLISLAYKKGIFIKIFIFQYDYLYVSISIGIIYFNYNGALILSILMY